MKKGISESKVQRMRNIVKGDYTKSVKTQVGYKKSDKKKEGDVWEEGNKTWTIKNGIKQNVSKMQEVRNIVKMPLTCPKCGKVMKGYFDAYHWKIDKHCLSCHAAKVTKLRSNNLDKDGNVPEYDNYVKELRKKNKLAEIKDITAEFEEWLDNSSTFVTELGEIEDWQGGIDKEEMRQKFKKELEEWKKHLEEQ